jgi:UDP-glucose 4-epimerase
MKDYNIAGKKIAVTGGAGFIGSNLVRKIVENNQVIIVDNLSTGKLDNIKNLVDEKKINFIEGSITNLKLLKKTFKNVDYVFHLAAVTSVPKSIKDPIKTNKVNVSGLLNVLIASKENNVEKVINSSSCAVYGDPIKYPISEKSIASPLSPYAASKLMGESYCQIFSDLYDLQTASLRYFNVYGPRQDPNGDYAAVIPKFINLALSCKDLMIYGNGKQTRDFVFVQDVVNANILLAKNNKNGIFNVGSGKSTSINSLAKIIIKYSKSDVKIRYLQPRKGDIIKSYADVSKIKNLGYSLEFDLEKGLRQTFDWFFRNTR